MSADDTDRCMWVIRQYPNFVFCEMDKDIVCAPSDGGINSEPIDNWSDEHDERTELN